MKQFDVVWNEDVADEMDEVIAKATHAEHSEIYDALVKLHKRLNDDPLKVGESRGDLSTRVETESAVTIHFRVIERLNLVRVFAVRVARLR